MVIYALTLLLNSLSQTEIALEHLFHHVHCVNNAFSNGILGLVNGRWQFRGVMLYSDVLKGFRFLFEELLDVIFVLDDSLGDYLPSFLTTLAASSLCFCARGRTLSPA